MHDACESHAWFIFTSTQKSHYIYRSFIAVFTSYTTFPPNLTPCILMSSPALLTWRTSFFARGDEYQSTLVSGLPTIAPPLALPLSPFHTPQFKLHYIHTRHQQTQSSSTGTIHVRPIIVFICKFCLLRDNKLFLYSFVLICLILLKTARAFMLNSYWFNELVSGFSPTAKWLLKER
jgi:hypothetical protein